MGSPTHTYPRAFKGDLFGGITASIIALPLALAFGVASGLGAQAGLYGAITVGLFAALFGGTNTQISGPTGPMTVAIASAFTVFQGNTSIVMAVILVAGIIQILLGVVKAGTLVRFIPYPVISGFMSGIGVIIIILQINPLLGHTIQSSPVLAIMGLPKALGAINPHAVLLSLATLAILYLTPKRLAVLLPTPLIALFIMTGISIGFGFSVESIGTIPPDLPSLTIPSIPPKLIPTIFMMGFSLAMLGSIDSLLTSIVADSLTRTKHNPNKELIGQGIGNLLTSFIGGIPGAGATMRTVVNIKSGGTTRVSGVVHALALLGIILGAAHYASFIPMAVLSGILIKVGLDIIDYRFLTLINRAPRMDASIMLAVFFLTVFIDLIVAVGVGIILASVMITIRMAATMEQQVDEIDLDQIPDLNLQDKKGHKIRVIHINGPFFFGSTSQVVHKVDSFLGTDVVVFDCTNVPFIDISAIFALEEMVLKLESIGTAVVIAVKPHTKQKLTRLGLCKNRKVKMLYKSLDQALEAAYAAAGALKAG